MLVSALLIIPAVTALQIAKGFQPAMMISGIISLLSVLVGITISFFLDLPAGATIVMVNVIIFGLVLMYKKIAS
jgi:zinc transport system permease protein